MKYVWMNEEDYVFAKEGSLVKVIYVENLFLGSLDVMSLIPKSHGIWTNDMKDVICYMQYVMCFVQYDTYDEACYSHGMTFLIQFGKSPNFPNSNLASPLTWLSINSISRKDLFLLIHVLYVFLHIPIHSTSLY